MCEDKMWVAGSAAVLPKGVGEQVVILVDFPITAKSHTFEYCLQELIYNMKTIALDLISFYDTGCVQYVQF